MKRQNWLKRDGKKRPGVFLGVHVVERLFEVWMTILVLESIDQADLVDENAERLNLFIKSTWFETLFSNDQLHVEIL